MFYAFITGAVILLQLLLLYLQSHNKSIKEATAHGEENGNFMSIVNKLQMK